jgi:hypothetical protein
LDRHTNLTRSDGHERREWSRQGRSSNVFGEDPSFLVQAGRRLLAVANDKKTDRWIGLRDVMDGCRRSRLLTKTRRRPHETTTSPPVAHRTVHRRRRRALLPGSTWLPALRTSANDCWTAPATSSCPPPSWSSSQRHAPNPEQARSVDGPAHSSGHLRIKGLGGSSPSKRTGPDQDIRRL